MTPFEQQHYFPKVWQDLLFDILENGTTVEPRGQKTSELLQRTIMVDTRRPVLTVPERGISYPFMAAEAYWIMSGDYRVETIEPYCPRIKKFSDDGETFFGAYGPKIVGQLQYVFHKLLEDRDTRQAGLTIWRENPPATKDMPCTVAVFFGIRENRLNAHVFMRSSDAWLGIPYDVFNFSMLTHLVCTALNGNGINYGIEPGMLYLTAASSHLYERNWDGAEACIDAPVSGQPKTPDVLWQDPVGFSDWMLKLKDSKPGDDLRWWES